MGLEASALHENQCLQGLAFKAMTDQIHSFKTAPQTSSNIKVQDLPLFKGRVSEVESFMYNVNSAIYLQPVLLNGMDQAKCIYMASWLDNGVPKTWLKAMLQHNNYFYDNWDTLLLLSAWPSASISRIWILRPASCVSLRSLHRPALPLCM